MAITSGFFNSVNQDRLYNAAQIGKYLQYIVGSGVFPYVSTSLQVLANDGMTVEVQAGRAMLDHHYLDNDAPITLTLTAGGTQDRVDAIVMYVDMTERACGITIKEGTPAASPVAPEMTRNDVRKEYMLAKVRVTKLSSAITQSSITDTRADSTVCGWVTGLIDQVDTSTLFLQFQTAYEEELAKTQDYLAAQQAAWQAFFDSVTLDNVLPAPALTQVGYVVTVNETGTGYVLAPAVTTDDTLTKSGNAADAAAVGKLFTVPNLLVNSDFSAPVNLGGKTSYTGVGDCMEKWFSSSGYGAVTVSDGYVNIKSANGSSAAYLLQFVEPAKIKSGKKYTAVCKLRDGSFHSVTAQASTSMTEAIKYIYIDGAQLGTIRIKYDAGQAQYAVLFSTTSAAGIDVEHVALYEGEFTAETMPVYCRQGYPAEAAACGVAGMDMELLWENGSPSSEFAATENPITIPGVSAYDLFMVEFVSGAPAAIVRKGVNSYPFLVTCTEQNSKLYLNLYYRRITVTADGFTAGNTQRIQYAATTFNLPAISNGYVKPYKIYGIKGVEA